MSSWTDWHAAQVAAGLDIGRAEIETFAGVPTSAHLVLHATGDVTAMVPFNRAKLKSDEPATRLADMSDVARATRAAKDYTDDMFARTIKRVQALEDGRDESPLSYPITMYEVRLAKENAALAKACDFLRVANDQQAKTICEMQTRIDQNAAFVKHLQQERDDIREGREKAVARCVELEEVNGHLRCLLGICQ